MRQVHEDSALGYWRVVMLAIAVLVFKRGEAEAGATSTAPPRKNVLLLVADDLRPQLNDAYGQTYMKTPNLDKFAAQSLVFDRAFTNFGICSASRNSFMSGRRPDLTRTWNFINHFRQAGVSKLGKLGRDWLTLPELFKKANYTTLGHGKLYHPNKPPNNDEPKSWSQEQPYVRLTTTGCRDGRHGERFCPEELPDEQFSDYNTTLSALQTLRKYGTVFTESGKERPFFIGLGLHFPHQSWAVPKWSVEAYDDTPPVPPKVPISPQNCPDIAFTAELDGNVNLTINQSNPLVPPYGRPSHVEGPTTFTCPVPGTSGNDVPDYFQLQMRVGYYSAVTHTDWLFGKVLRELDELGIANDTLVVLHGDHGWQLGEHAEWGKHTNWELSVQVPLLMRAPWIASSVGKHTSGFVELLDLYKTIASVAGVGEAVPGDVDGDDVSHLLYAPDSPGKAYAFAQYSRCPGDRYWPKTQPGHPAWYLNNCESVPAENMTSMGYTVRSENWRYTEWFKWDGANCRALFHESTLGNELYSHRGEAGLALDFDSWENDNVVEDPQNAEVVKQHRTLLLLHFDVEATKGLGCPPPLEDYEADSWCNINHGQEAEHEYDADVAIHTCVGGKMSGRPCTVDSDCNKDK